MMDEHDSMRWAGSAPALFAAGAPECGSPAGRPVRESRSRGAHRDTSHTHAPSPEGPGSRLDVHHLPRESPANVKSPPRQVTRSEERRVGKECTKHGYRSAMYA